MPSPSRNSQASEPLHPAPWQPVDAEHAGTAVTPRADQHTRPLLNLTADCRLPSRVLQECSREFSVYVASLPPGGRLRDSRSPLPDLADSRAVALALAVQGWQHATQARATAGEAGTSTLTAGATLLTGEWRAGTCDSSNQSQQCERLVAVHTGSASAVWRLPATGQLASSASPPEGSLHESAASIRLLAASLSWLSSHFAGRIPNRHEPPADVIPHHPDQLAVAAPPLVALYHQQRAALWSAPGGDWQSTPPAGPFALLSGSFNPRHAGHSQLAQVAAARLQLPVYSELPVINADKPPLDYLSLTSRLQQFDREWLAVTAAPTFAEKARLFPGTVFVVGADTAARILQPRFYGDCVQRMHDVLRELDARGCRFLVAARLAGNQLLTLSRLHVPPSLGHLFEELPATEFRLDISSTAHRRRQQSS